MSETVTVRKAAEGVLQQEIEVHGNRWFADASEAAGGEGAGPEPHEILDAALGACTALTLTLVARRKQIPLEDVIVRLTHVEAEGTYTMTRRIELVGRLSEEQRSYLLGIASKCPVHKTLSGHIVIDTALA